MKKPPVNLLHVSKSMAEKLAELAKDPEVRAAATEAAKALTRLINAVKKSSRKQAAGNSGHK